MSKMDESQPPAKTRPPETGFAPMDKRKRRPPPNYFARNEQVRLLILCSLLMFVLIMMNEARKPSTWKWMWRSHSEVAVEPSQPIDTRLDTRIPSLPSDGFRTVPTDSSHRQETATESNLLPGITAELLAPIKDNTVMRAAENNAWLTMLELLHNKKQSEIVSLSTGQVSFAQLFRQTDFYRGKLVTV